MRTRVNVFLSSAQHDGEFELERTILPIIFEKEPLVSIFNLWKIEDQAAPISIRDQYLTHIKQSQLVILLIDKTARDAVKEEVEEAIKNSIPIYPFIKYNENRNAEVETFIKYIRESALTTSTYYSSIDELIKKIEDSLLDVFTVKFSSRNKSTGGLVDTTRSIVTFEKFEKDIIKPGIDKFIYDAIIIGSWNAESSGDKEIITEFTGENIDNWELKIREIITYAKNLVYFNNGHWKINDRKSLFYKYAGRFLNSDLDKLKSVAIKVLKEIDPMFELEPKNRFAANVYGKIPKYSKDIKKGISEILALFTVNEEKLSACSDFRVLQIVDSIILEVLENADWKLWASLNDFLPILAESSPVKFMEVVEKSLGKSPCTFDELFIQNGDDITGWNYMTGLYWALEALAWSEDYISKSILLLSELATHDPGGKWINSPINSLVTILLPWFPQTIVPFNKQLNSLKIVQRYFPDIAFKIILRFFPNVFQMTYGSYKPLYRNQIDPEWRPEVTDTEYFEHIREYAKMAIEMVKTNKEYLLSLLDIIENIPHEELAALLSYLLSDEINTISDEDRFLIWEKLNFTVNKHRKFSDAKWALDKESIDEIQKIADNIKPDNPIYLYRHLFSNNDHFYFEVDIDWEAYTQEIEKARKDALHEIYRYGGIDAIFQFAFSVEDQYKIGFSLRTIDDKKFQNNILPNYLDSTEKKKKQLVNGYVIGNFSKEGEAWIDAIDLSSWNKSQICSLLLIIAYSETIWHKVPKLLDDYVNNFWEKINISPYAMHGNLIIAIDNLLNYCRPLYAAEIIYIHYFRTKELLMDKALLALISGITSNENFDNLDRHCLLELIKLIQNEKDIDQEKLFQIEWAYLSLLDEHYGGKTVTLQKQLSSDPSFFLTLLKLLYYSEKNDEIDSTIIAKKQAAANNARQLLEEWNLIPGMTDNNVFSESLLIDWFFSVKKLCDNEVYLSITMFHIGRVFYFAPQDVNGLWINKKVAELLDDKDSIDLRRGYFNEAFNSRGAHFVDKTGSEEREIAELWRRRSQDLENEGFIYFAETAKEIAITYEHEAKRNLSQFGSLNNDEETTNP
jgi:hypothetical protein